MNRIVATMDDLPELPFEKVLSYLSLEDRLKAGAVSRRWYTTINSFKVKSLCYSKRPAGFIEGKSRWISGAFAQNFISSPRFASFFDTYGHSILSNLKHLRICNLHLKAEDNGASPFVLTLKLFDQLEELDLIRFTYSSASGPGGEFELNLLMLTSIRLEEVEGIDQLTLDSPMLKRVKLLECPPSLRLELVHPDSIEWLATSSLGHVEVKNLKSLMYLHCGPYPEIDATFLSGLEKLKEVHTLNQDCVSSLFEQKQRYGRTDLKIFSSGFLLNGPDDPAIDSLFGFQKSFDCLAENPSRLADEVPLYTALSYSALDGVAPESAINVLSRFTDLNTIWTDSSIPAKDVQRFLDLLKNLPNIVNLQFYCDQPQDLFDRLPEHSTVQHLRIDHPVSDLRFLLRLEYLLYLEYLIHLEYSDQITAEVVRKAFEELHFLSVLRFKHFNNQTVTILKASTNRWTVWINEKRTDVAGLNAAIQVVFGILQRYCALL